jgi:hypothetical protein
MNRTGSATRDNPEGETLGARFVVWLPVAR